MRVVIVDDEWNGLDLVRELLHQIRPAMQIVGIYQDPQEALRNIPLVDPDLVILDVEMPYMNGFQLHQKLRDSKAHFLMTTAHDIRDLAAQNGGYKTDFISKPFNKRELEEKIMQIETLIKS